MKADAKKILASSGGAFAAGVAMKMVKNPLTAIVALGGGIYLATKGSNETSKAFGLGLASVGAIGTAGKVAEKVEALQKFTPQINGIGELYEDEDGNIIELGGLNGQPELVQDEFGNTYMVNGLNGSELDNLVGTEDLEALVGDDDDFDDYELDGLAGEELATLV